MLSICYILQCFSYRTFFCVHVRKLGTSVRKSTTKTDLQNLPNQFRSEQTSLSFQKKNRYKSEFTVVSLVANRRACIDRDLAYEVQMLAFELLLLLFLFYTALAKEGYY